MKPKKKPDKEKKGWSWWKILLVILLLLWLADSCEEKECEGTFAKFIDYDGCYSACSSKCYGEGFESGSGYTVTAYEDGTRECECICEGCR